jgi:hypothetical protein
MFKVYWASEEGLLVLFLELTWSMP